MKKYAIISAASLEVGCPDCGEPQPSPDNGSHLWTPGEVTAASSTQHTCTACDLVFTIIAQNRVSVQS